MYSDGKWNLKSALWIWKSKVGNYEVKVPAMVWKAKRYDIKDNDSKVKGQGIGIKVKLEYMVNVFTKPMINV